ncbi:ABC transporter permease [Pseudomonas oryzihabitans]|uniref:ABC transporter permease n=1 Tax=Pseudomonas rhizoryzae TaxID=2571129 RepID=UPI000737099D|nr:ABC transporter permease [Pseudomonas rhizoryzae]KTS79283.1 ABC transporter permease [Pseudomonas psychrotolerans]KTT30992.1 ABC transporter permease [Pseudomonas psychrotolerans]KTT34025.1 ABC transporter permease [Pseudomonas psychrotolerans]KTT64389.1 ABC transporter permease [Pseudomonas psychrotolerans]KTT76590.1 ABC transporter permease [Pseudomonas psychrotolerans]
MSLDSTGVFAAPPARSSARWLGLGLLTALVAFAVLTPLLWSGDIARQDYLAILAAPSDVYPLGTDHLGRDMLARLAVAIRFSLGLAFISVCTAAIPGVLLGILAAWKGGAVDKLLGGVAELFLALPGLLLVLLIVAVFPGSFIALYSAVALVLWVEYFRMTRALSRTVLASPAVAASQLLGFGPVYIARRHLWPQLAPVLLTIAAFGAASTIMAIAALGFVSIGVRPPTAELGLMITELLPYYAEAPFVIALPIIAIFLTVLSLMLITGGRKP